MPSAVNAIYDYEATGPDEFSFSQGDVIAVTMTDVSPLFVWESEQELIVWSLQPDGWWQGNPVGVSGGGHIFPSK